MPSSGRVFYFLSTADSVREARREVERLLRDWGCGEDATDRMVLCVSEFASNAIEHAGGSQGYLVLCVLDDGILTVGVLDFDECSLPCRTEVSPEQVTGRGLMIVEGVADSWAVTPFKGGKMVFAQAKVAPADLVAPAARAPLSWPKLAGPGAAGGRAGNGAGLAGSRRGGNGTGGRSVHGGGNGTGGRSVHGGGNGTGAGQCTVGYRPANRISGSPASATYGMASTPAMMSR
jgi:anti-sigma regulatory factor (Ser/Thr protein kinase)